MFNGVHTVTKGKKLFMPGSMRQHRQQKGECKNIACERQVRTTVTEHVSKRRTSRSMRDSGGATFRSATGNRTGDGVEVMTSRKRPLVVEGS